MVHELERRKEVLAYRRRALEKYASAVAKQKAMIKQEDMTKQKYAELQKEWETIKFSESIEFTRQCEIEVLMDLSPWALHPDTGDVISLDELKRIEKET